jgi:argininosuccinate lyase
MSSFRDRLQRQQDPILRRMADTQIAYELEHTLGYHLAINRAHALMLAEQGIVSHDDAQAIVAALDALGGDPADLGADTDAEDLFSVLESRLVDKLGVEVAGRLHTGRSRNDYYMTVNRMAMRDALDTLASALQALNAVLVDRAAQFVTLTFPGYTHNSQQAQPITLGHFLLAHFDAFSRDLDRLQACRERTNQSPMGAAALAGTDFPLDRQQVADHLGFSGLVENTQDASGIRDYQIEALGVGVVAALNANRFTESLIMYATTEFGLITLDDSLCGVSSIMPQKKNPVALEHVETLLPRLLGAMTISATTLKSTTIGMSEEAISIDGVGLDAIHALAEGLELLSRAVATFTVNDSVVADRLRSGLFTVTQVADFLVGSVGLPFRLAHGVVARAIGECMNHEINMRSADGMQAFYDALARSYADQCRTPLPADAATVAELLDPDYAVRKRELPGSPGVIPATEMIRLRRTALRERVEQD